MVRAFNSGVMSDLKNIAIAQEAYFTDNGVYAESLAAFSGSTRITITNGVDISISRGDDAFTLIGYHSSGSKTYTLTGPGSTLESS